MGGKVNLTGRRFSRLTVVNENGRSKSGNVMWFCLCDCGKKVSVASTNLLTGNTNSCGCYMKDRLLEYSTTHGYSGKRNLPAKPEYTAWMNIKSRCLNKKDKGYKHYGGRGIKVCDRWLKSFNNFLIDMGDKPTPKHSIERRNVNGDYEPSNCYWATIKEQVRNKRTTHWIEHDGVRLNMTDWANKIGAYEENLRRMMKKKTFAECVNYYTSNNRRKRCNKKSII